MESVIQRDLGNDAYKTGDYVKAVGYYTLAIGAIRAEIFDKPDKGKLKFFLSSYYTSRAASLTKLKQYDEALEDCKFAMEFDRTAVKPYQRQARVYMQRGMLDAAMETYDKGIQFDVAAVTVDRKHTETTKRKFENAKTVMEQQRKNEQRGERTAAVERVKEDLKAILKFCPDWSEARILQAEAHFYTADYEEAYQLASSLVKGGLSKHRNLLILRTQLMLNKGHLDDAVKQVWVISRRNSNCERSSELNEKVNRIKQLRDQAEDYYKNKQYELAARHCSTAIELCPETAEGMVAKLQFSRSAAYASLGAHFKAIEDYTNVLKYDPSHVKAYLRRGLSFLAIKNGGRLKNCQHAIKSFELALELCLPSTPIEEEIQQKLNEAQREVQKARMKSKDYFAVLGVPRSANLAAIYNTYRMQSLHIHNFKLSSNSPREIGEAENHYQELSEAYEILSEACKNGTINEFASYVPTQQHSSNNTAAAANAAAIARQPGVAGNRAKSENAVRLNDVNASRLSPTRAVKQQIFQGDSFRGQPGLAGNKTTSEISVRPGLSGNRAKSENYVGPNSADVSRLSPATAVRQQSLRGDSFRGQPGLAGNRAKSEIPVRPGLVGNRAKSENYVGLNAADASQLSPQVKQQSFRVGSLRGQPGFNGNRPKSGISARPGLSGNRAKSENCVGLNDPDASRLSSTTVTTQQNSRGDSFRESHGLAGNTSLSEISARPGLSGKRAKSENCVGLNDANASHLSPATAARQQSSRADSSRADSSRGQPGIGGNRAKSEISARPGLAGSRAKSENRIGPSDPNASRLSPTRAARQQSYKGESFRSNTSSRSSSPRPSHLTTSTSPSRGNGLRTSNSSRVLGSRVANRSNLDEGTFMQKKLQGSSHSLSLDDDCFDGSRVRRGTSPIRRGLGESCLPNRNTENGSCRDLVQKQGGYKGMDIRGQERHDSMLLVKKPSIRSNLISASQA